MVDYKDLAIIANKIRQLALEGICNAKSGHPGGSLSIAEILTVLFFKEMNVSAENRSEDRDRFVLSKGHACPSYYAALAMKGFFDVEEVKKLRDISSFLQGHPVRDKVPGVDMSTGSLGQGLSAANGMALIAKIDNRPYRTYCVCGDGEIQEGQIWEAAMTAAHYKLDAITLFVDDNGLQIDGATKDVMDVGNIAEKFKAFGWNTIVIDGHSFEEIDMAIAKAKECKGMPTCVVCKTIKGKGVSFMENNANWHGAAPNDEQFAIAIKELKEELAELEVK